MINWVRVITLAIMVMVPVSSRAEGTGGGTEAPLNLLNPRITVFGNATLSHLDDRVPDSKADLLLRSFGLTEDDMAHSKSRFSLRETEIDLRSAVDPFADGVVIMSLKQEISGAFEPEIEEGFVRIKALPWVEQMPGGLSLTIGRFRGDLGQMNAVHTHDLPQTTRPLVVREFLGEEGYVGEGASLAGQIPIPSDVASIDFAAQLTNGGGLATSPDRSGVAYLGRGRLFWNPTSTHTMTFGIAAHNGKAAAHQTVTTGSTDLLYKWKPLRGGEWRSFLLGGELFRTFGRERVPDAQLENRLVGSESPAPEQAELVGYYLFSQVQLNRSIYVGSRWDWSGHLSRCGEVEADRLLGEISYSRTCEETEFSLEHLASNMGDRSTLRQLTPYVTYYFSEFLRFRTSWERTWPRDDTFWLELNFVIGSHPPEPYWVNK